MTCPSGGLFRASQFTNAMQNLDLWQAGYCMYATPMSELVVGTVVDGAVSLGIFISTGSLVIPAVLYIILGSTITFQMLSIISPLIGFLVLLVAPIAATALVYNVDRLG